MYLVFLIFYLFPDWPLFRKWKNNHGKVGKFMIISVIAVVPEKMKASEEFASRSRFIHEI